MDGAERFIEGNLCVAVQYFVKHDTTLATLETVRRMAGGRGISLLLMQDGIEGARREDERRGVHAECGAAVEDWCATHAAAFARIKHRRLPRNHGTCGTAREIIDAALDLGDWVLFAEDDVLFCDSALDWFVTAVNSDVFAREEVWAVAGESKAFDARGAAVDPDRREADRTRAEALGLVSRYVLFDFLPSSCFATTRAKWAEFGETRGLPNGVRDLNLRCRAEAQRSLWPVIARCRDEGMHHPLGYSMMMRKGDAAAIAGKSVYLTADDLEPGAGFTPLEKTLTGLFTEWRAAS
ncbi:hypothetical protein GI374_09760 [Paracoccus sp. S-4012]|uniref:hypothetical protein n=1 Tax=Paracoccus sp. S-4012 TaxID=2665648 RepID=UPI0012AFD8DF|nr:hypothetical protein [Paracoccus sp. S-4012]MRX50725.1 hypothetical protein [Paracoccus sp. S-4012]